MVLSMFSLLKKISFSLVLIISSALFADDIDLISLEQTAYDANILMIMDASGSMDWNSNGGIADPLDPNNPSRMAILKNALTSVLNDPDLKDINIGLSSFAGDLSHSGYHQTAHGISYPVSPIDKSAQQVLDQNPLFDHPGNSFLPPTTSTVQTSRSYLQTIANTWTPHGGTPIVDALFEGALYFRGLPTNWGRHDPSKNRAAHPSTYVGLLEDTTSTTTGLQCNDLPCEGDSCNDTKVCSATTDVLTCSTPTCGNVCVGPTTVKEECSEGVTSCGTGLNCVEGLQVEKDAICLTNDADLCMEAAADEGRILFNCQSESETVCSTILGINQCLEVNYQQCKEKIRVSVCDAESYECSTETNSCQHEICEEVTTNTTVLTGDAVFVSPIKEECPANGIILLSDGAPTVNLSADLASTMMGSANSNNCDTGDDSGRCGVELASYLANGDNSTAVAGVQKVNTFTLGMSLQNNPDAEIYLKNLAKSGGGEFINASSPDTLVAALKLAIDGVVSTRARSFTAPSYSVDTTNLLSHDGMVYIPVFDRKGVVWPGNLKKFVLENDVLKDINGNVVTDSNGALLKTARDLWSSGTGDDAIRSGGAASNINPNNRNILTDNGASLLALNNNLSNSSFENMGVVITDDEKQKLVTYIRGINPEDDTVRNHMGDIIHSKPIKLNRESGSATIFVGTNEGYLHAINDEDGNEQFAYMPEELLSNIHDQYHKNIRASGHIYGVDGPITLWIDDRSSSIDKRNNNILDSGERAYLFFGLRRGGKNYYALDVTNASNPTLVWKKSFGTGDSWSQPVLEMLRWDEDTQDEPAPVLVFGGGYNDENNNGNAVYVISALAEPDTGIPAGGIVWSTDVATNSTDSIENGVPARIRTIDMDRNGSIDRLYFGDTGGNVWRVDLNAGDYSENESDKGDISKAKLYKLAELGGLGDANRRFFEEPDVAIFRQAGSLVATIAIGSGDRTNPLESVINDKFFVLYDRELKGEPEDPILTLDLLKDSDDVVFADIGNENFRGWKKTLDMTIGEKVLAPAITYQNKVLFTTFGSVSVEPDACNPTNSTSASLYILDLISGETYTSVEVSNGEILGTPQIFFKGLSDGAGTGACVSGDCTRKEVIRVGKAGPFALPSVGSFQEAGQADPTIIPRVYWIDNEQQY